MNKIVRLIAFFIFALVLILLGTSIFMFNVALARKTKSSDIADELKSASRNQDVKLWIDSLKNNVALRDTIILNDQGQKIHGYFINSPILSKKTAILVHGYTTNGLNMLPIGKIYSDMGYNIILPDLHAHGLSDGKHIQMGWKDRNDIIRWIDFDKQLYGDSTQMVLHGVSMGAATVMMTSGEKLSQSVKAIVEDCGYTSVWDEYVHELKKRYNLPAFPILYITSGLVQLLDGWNFKEASSIKQLRKTKLPIFFIHGGNDDFVPTQMVYKLYDAKEGPKELWIEPDVTHANMYWNNPKEYAKRIEDFTNKYIE